MEEKPRILVVDADEDHLEAVARCLADVARVDTATTGEEGWALVQASDPELVIADQQLPGLPGVELLHRAGRRDDHVGRILLTGFGDTQATADAMERHRVDAYVSKPCLPHQLRLTVASVAERCRLARDNARLFADLVNKNQELREAMASLRLAQRRVLDSERLGAIGRMIGMIVHDFRGPLSVIRSGAGALVGDVSAGDLGEISTEIREETDRMARMCDELLEVTRASGGPLHQRETDLDELVADVLARFAEEAGRGGVRLEGRLESGARLLLDADRLRRALLNLVYNALEAMPEGGTIEVGSERLEDGVRLRIADTGRGIPPEIAARVFEPFVTHDKQQGSGLGLAVVRKVLEDHGATVRLVKPAAGEGTTFELDFPAFLLCKPR